MNRHQRLIVTLAIAIAVAMLLFPPFMIRLQNGIVTNLGYAFLLDPPKWSTTALTGSVDVTMLGAQWVVLSAAAAALWWLSQSKSQVETSSHDDATVVLPKVDESSKIKPTAHHIALRYSRIVGALFAIATVLLYVAASWDLEFSPMALARTIGSSVVEIGVVILIAGGIAYLVTRLILWASTSARVK